MRYLIIPTDRNATHTDADGNRLIVRELADSVVLHSKTPPIIFDSLSALETAHGLTAIQPTPLTLEQVRALRAKAYPAIGDQLDAIWHAMDDGLFPKIEPMYSEVAEVKARFPKP